MKDPSVSQTSDTLPSILRGVTPLQLFSFYFPGVKVLF